MKLPLQRMTYSGSTSSWIADADGNDIARVSGGNMTKAVVAFHDTVAEKLVDGANNVDALRESLKAQTKAWNEAVDRGDKYAKEAAAMRARLALIRIQADNIPECGNIRQILRAGDRLVQAVAPKESK